MVYQLLMLPKCFLCLSSFASLHHNHFEAERLRDWAKKKCITKIFFLIFPHLPLVHNAFHCYVQEISHLHAEETGFLLLYVVQTRHILQT